MQNGIQLGALRGIDRGDVTVQRRAQGGGASTQQAHARSAKPGAELIGGMHPAMQKSRQTGGGGCMFVAEETSLQHRVAQCCGSDGASGRRDDRAKLAGLEQQLAVPGMQG